MGCTFQFSRAYLISSLLAIVLSSLQSSTVLACDTRKPINGHTGRIFSFSQKAPLTSVLGKDETYVNSTHLLLRHFQNVDDYIGNETMSLTRLKDERPLVCADDTRWSKAEKSVAESNGWKATIPPCVSNLFHIPSTSTRSLQYSVDDLYRALVTRVGLGRNMSRSIQKALKIWTDVNITFRGNDSVVRQNIKCDLYFTLGFRIDGEWFMSNSYSTHRQNHWAAEGKRQIVVEYTKVERGIDYSKPTLLPMELSLPVRPPANATNNKHCLTNESTTRLAIRSGSSSVSGFYGVTADKIEVIADVLEKAEITIRHANDALFWSNIAILSLPLMVNLVPLSIVSNVKSRRVFIYLIITRVLAALPMLIKGVEIIVISQKEFTSILTRTGVGRSKTDIVAAELWIAKCQVNEDIEGKGISFIVTAVLSVLLGLLFEIIAIWQAKKKYNQYMLLRGVTPHIRSEEFRNTLLKDMDLEYEMSDIDGKDSDV